MLRTSLSGLVLALAIVSGCDGSDTGADAGGGDAGADGGGGAADGGGSDAGELDAGEVDAGEVDAGTSDAGALDGGEPASCEAAGGTCVAVVPSACPTGILGSAEWYTCGVGIGVTCCLPPDTPPACRAVGTRSEGWYRADGTRICFATCAGASVACEAIGSRSEGWYTDVAGAACTTPPVDRLVEWADCSP